MKKSFVNLALSLHFELSGAYLNDECNLMLYYFINASANLTVVSSYQFIAFMAKLLLCICLQRYLLSL